MNIDSKTLSELERHFNAKGNIASKLPDAKSVKDFSEIYMKNNDNTYDSYKMIKGEWVKTSSNTSTVTKIIQGGPSGSAQNITNINQIPDRSHTDLKDIGTNTHAQIDSHISNISNPHSVTKTQVGLSNVTNDAQLKASDLDTDGTLSANSDSKIPSQKAVKTYVDDHFYNIDGGYSGSTYSGAQIIDCGGA